MIAVDLLLTGLEEVGSVELVAKRMSKKAYKSIHQKSMQNSLPMYIHNLTNT